LTRSDAITFLDHSFSVPHLMEITQETGDLARHGNL